MEGALCRKTGVIDETPRAEDGMLGKEASVGRPKGNNERGGWGSTESRMDSGFGRGSVGRPGGRSNEKMGTGPLRPAT